MRWTRVAVLLTASLLVITCTACGAPDPGSHPVEETMSAKPSSKSPPPDDESRPTPPSSTELPTMSPPTGPPTEPSEYRPVVVAGTVQAGDGCLQLVASDTGTRYALRGRLTDGLVPGVDVKLRGSPSPNRLPECPQSIVLSVTEVLTGD